jgi:2-aminoadipate transaminase
MTQYEQFFSRAGQTMRESAIRKMGAVLAQARDMISFAPGYPAEDSFAWDAFADIARDLLSGDDGSVLQYGPTRGYKPLRDFIAGMMQERHITAIASSVVVTTGSQQGLDLLARVLFDPDDVVLVELPSYTGAITAFRSVGASLVGVRQNVDGVDLDELDETIVRLRGEGRRVKALYVVPNFQNPTGLVLGAAKRPHLAEWAEKRNVLVIEDDPYRDLYFPDVASESDTRPIAADDTNGRVIYLSSFSKTLAPGFRVAWLHAPEPIAAKLEIAKQAEDLCSGGLDQRVVYEACRRGILAKNLPKLRLHYQNKRDVMVKALNQHLGGKLTWPDPRGGFFLWAKLAGSLQTDALLARARERGVIFVAGSAFFVDGSGAQHLRLSFSAPPPDRIEEGVARLAAAVSDASAEAGQPATHAGSR